MKKLLSLILIVISIYANGQCWSKVAGGYSHTIALKNNGTLWACGNQGFGQLGDGTYYDKNTFIQIGTQIDWQTIAAGNSYTLAIKTNGTLWGWGDANNTPKGVQPSSKLFNRFVIVRYSYE